MRKKNYAIIIAGAGKRIGLTVCGSYKNMKAVDDIDGDIYNIN